MRRMFEWRRKNFSLLSRNISIRAFHSWNLMFTSHHVHSCHEWSFCGSRTFLIHQTFSHVTSSAKLREKYFTLFYFSSYFLVPCFRLMRLIFLAFLPTRAKNYFITLHTRFSLSLCLVQQSWDVIHLNFLVYVIRRFELCAEVFWVKFAYLCTERMMVELSLWRKNLNFANTQ
jgi:hypothetical protein